MDTFVISFILKDLLRLPVIYAMSSTECGIPRHIVDNQVESFSWSILVDVSWMVLSAMPIVHFRRKLKGLPTGYYILPITMYILSWIIHMNPIKQYNSVECGQMTFQISRFLANAGHIVSTVFSSVSSVLTLNAICVVSY